MSEHKEQGRSAKAFEPAGSEAVVNVTTYQFGSTPQSTRPDRVLRVPTAALLVHCKGRAIEYQRGDRITELPQLALLGPDSRARIWATRPNTHFLMANLAPGAVQALFGMDPGEIANRTESLDDHPLAEFLFSAPGNDASVLSRRLEFIVRRKNRKDHGYSGAQRQRVRDVIRSLRERQFGERVRDYADHFGVTIRTLQRMISAEVGLSPKQVLSVARLRAMITLTSGGWTGSVADLAQAGGFFDQSHLRCEVQSRRFGNIDNLLNGEHLVVRH